LMLRDGNGQSCLSLAVEKNNAKLVPVLLEAAGERKLELLMINCNGDMGPLYMAAYRGLADVVKELLEAAGEQKLLMLNTDSGRVSLHIAAELVHVDVVNVLLAYVAACDPPTQRALLLARRSRGGDAEGQPTGMGCLQVLLRSQVRTFWASDAKTLSETMLKPLLQAADNAGVLGELLTMTERDGSTCLHAVVDNCHRVYDYVKVLLHAADNARVLVELLMMTDHEGSTFLHKVQFEPNLVEVLVEAAGTAGVLGELLTMTDHKGRTCLHAVVDHSFNVGDVLKVLLRAALTAGVLSKVLMMTDHEGSTLLRYAATRAELRTLFELEGRRCVWMRSFTAEEFHSKAVREALAMEAAVGRSAPTRGRTRLLHLLYSPVWYL
jgi:hypothetical protein